MKNYHSEFRIQGSTIYMTSGLVLDNVIQLKRRNNSHLEQLSALDNALSVHMCVCAIIMFTKQCSGF